MRLSLSVQTDLKSIGVLSGRAWKGLENDLAERIARDTERFVPMRSGQLRSRTFVRGNEIDYASHYASYVYNMHGVNWTTSGTSGQWAERSINVNERAWSDWIERQVKD